MPHTLGSVIKHLVLLASLLLISGLANAASYNLGAVHVNTNTIFDPTTANASAELINRLHFVTKDKVIRREVWIEPGKPITDEDAEEIERNLRELDLFARVRVELIPHDRDPSIADLDINTFDSLSIVASAGGSFLGGIGEVKFSVGDKNLLGLGHKLIFGYSENTAGELLGSIAYDNVLVYGTDVYTGVRFGRTEAGDFAEVLLQNRFQHYRDYLSWSVRADYQNTSIALVDDNESVVAVPRTRSRIRSSRIQRRGSAGRFHSFGPVLNVTELEYGSPTTSDASLVNIPEDNTRVFLGLFFGRQHIRDYEKVTFLDTLGYEQDLTLGNNAELSAGFTHVNAETTNKTLPGVFLNAWSHNALNDNTYLNLATNSNVQLNKNETDAWTITTAATAFRTRSNGHTAAARLSYASFFNSDGLPSDQSLGESNGLRGYPASEFSGEQKLLLNLEYRFRTPLEYASIELGGLGFIDTGWVGSRGSSDWLNDARASVGAGLRIGSAPLLGSNIIRIDVAFPLDNDSEQDYPPTVSLAVGQVFGFKP